MRYKLTNTTQKTLKGARNVYLSVAGKLLKPGDECLANRLDGGTQRLVDEGSIEVKEGNFERPPLFPDEPTEPRKPPSRVIEVPDPRKAPPTPAPQPAPPPVVAPPPTPAPPPAQAKEAAPLPPPPEAGTVEAVAASSETEEAPHKAAAAPAPAKRRRRRGVKG